MDRNTSNISFYCRESKKNRPRYFFTLSLAKLAKDLPKICLHIALKAESTWQKTLLRPAV